MNDSELLELAAKAAGYDCRWHPDDPFALRSMCIAPNWQAWNPLDDDGDAFRLAAKLGLCVMFHATQVEYSKGAGQVRVVVEQTFRDADATRRAIVRAAAEIGKAMK